MVGTMAFKIKRTHTKCVHIGTVPIGGKHPLAVQSMIKIPTKNVGAVVRQIQALKDCGCEIIRVAVKDNDDAASLAKIKKQIHIPLVADIHFNYRFALAAIDAGVDKIRLNPGNIYKKEQVRAIASLARQRNLPIRVGSNSGSIRPRYRKQKTTVAALVKQTHDYIKMLEDYGVDKIVISLKSSDIFETIEAYKKMSTLSSYPLHLGVTATGLLRDGIVKSSIGIGILLAQGIGDTIRVSLLGDPKDEVAVARSILSALSIRQFGPQYICCPTCGRCEVDLKRKVGELSQKISTMNHKDLSRFSIAVMGCMVNGPGEAQHADLGVAFGRSKGILFKKGKVIHTLAQNRCIDTLIKQLKDS